MTSEQASMLRSQFNLKEINYKNRIRDLENNVQEQRDMMKESTLELSLTFEKKSEGYAEYDEADRDILL